MERFIHEAIWIWHFIYRKAFNYQFNFLVDKKCSDFLFLLLVLVSNVFQRIHQFYLPCQMNRCIVLYKLIHYLLMSVGAVFSFLFLILIICVFSICPLINLTRSNNFVSLFKEPVLTLLILLCIYYFILIIYCILLSSWAWFAFLSLPSQDRGLD